MVAVPNTRTRLSHALTIRAAGRTIGAVHSISPSQSRTVDQEFEVEANSKGMPIDLVPQTVDKRELRVSRYDLYTSIMEEVFGNYEIINLCDQYRPFTLREVWSSRLPGSNAVNFLNSAPTLIGQPFGQVTNPLASLPPLARSALSFAGSDRRQYEYNGCWFQDIGRQIDAKGDRVISVEATIMYFQKNRLG